MTDGGGALRVALPTDRGNSVSMGGSGSSIGGPGMNADLDRAGVALAPVLESFESEVAFEIGSQGHARMPAERPTRIGQGIGIGPGSGRGGLRPSGASRSTSSMDLSRDPSTGALISPPASASAGIAGGGALPLEAMQREALSRGSSATMGEDDAASSLGPPPPQSSSSGVGDMYSPDSLAGEQRWRRTGR